MSGFLETIRSEWPVIRQAPPTIGLSVLILAVAASGVIYWGFHENLSRKDDLIHTLEGQLAAKKPTERTLGSGPSAPLPSGQATTTGEGNIANTGNGNTFNGALRR